MAFDTTTRKRLSDFVADARRVLMEEFAEQLQSLYGISVTGDIAPLERLTHLDAEGLELAATLRQRIAYLTSSSPEARDATKAAVDRLTREQAFTVLNRLAAIRMAEKRGLIVESVGQQYQSKGFKVFESVAGSAIGDTYDRYRCYLFCLFDELAIDLGALFDRCSPQALLFPREKSLLALLGLLDEADLQDLWAEGETIGWIYQYYNDPAERKMMREESAAPRNSRELAVRNQFFTPRYVVEFLTDNTLGRIWYEMTQGATTLKEQCRYLVRRPDEVFFAQADSGEVEEAQAWLQDAKGKRPDLWRLAHTVNGYARAGAAGEDSNRWVEDRLPRVRPDTIAALATQELLDLLFLFCRKERFCEGTLDSLQAEIDLILETIETRSANGRRTDASQEDLLKQPVFIPHRPLKDPRNILLLDPACGSMHFGLYAFDLFEAIYDEAWGIATGSDEAAKSGELFAPFCAFAASFPDKAAFQRDVPRMIVEHNLHGVDIDPRAAQIAGLSLWLRAQRAWNAAGVKPVDRPRITRSNIVCAEPMPGDKVILAEFVEQQFPEGERAAFGFLLETVFDRMTLAGEAGSLLKIEEEIRTAIAEAKKLWEKEPTLTQRMLFAGGEEKHGDTQKKLDLSGITDEQFWEGAEDRIYAALSDYAEQAESGGFQRRLFAEDAARGFAFIDACRKRYAVVVMNPPFGDPSPRIFDHLAARYPYWNGNLLCAFVERALQMLDTQGAVGCIYDRTANEKATYEAYRRHCVLPGGRLALVADLGWGVLDANVETSAQVLINGRRGDGIFFDLRAAHVDAKSAYLLNKIIAEACVADAVACGESFLALPNAAIAYDMPASIRRVFSECPSLQDSSAYAVVGHQLKSDWHMSCWWEVPESGLGPNGIYRRLYNGGAFCRYYMPLTEVGLWGRDGELVREHKSVYLRNASYHFQPAIGYGKRGDCVDAHALPAGFLFTNEGQAVVPASAANRYFFLAILNSRLFTALINLYCGQHKQSGYVNLFPIPADIEGSLLERISTLAQECVSLKHSVDTSNEASPCFAGIPQRRHDIVSEVLDLVSRKADEVEELLREAYRLTPEDKEWILATQPSWPMDSIGYFGAEPACTSEARDAIASQVSFALGAAFGRWDARCASDERPQPASKDLFAELPCLPPGMLKDDDGLPLSVDAGRRPHRETGYPINVQWDGILVDDPDHAFDIERQIRAALAVLWGEQSETTENEACATLGVSTLREWFQRPSEFFADHLKRYSKSRRQAPIYWPLSTNSGEYTLWIYYHRLNDQTLHKCLADFLDPKIKDVENQLGKLAGKDSGRAADLRDFLNELKDLKDEIERVIKLPWKPNLNDGVLITASPLWKLFRLSKWQKDLKACWEELEKGDYDWAHLAYTIWPERVEKVCEKDRSIAIAHGLEHLCKVEPPKPKKPRGKKAPS